MSDTSEVSMAGDKQPAAAAPGVMESARTTAGAAQSAIGVKATNVKATVAGAAGNALGAVQQCGKDGTATAGKYVDKAQDYLNNQSSKSQPIGAAHEEVKEEAKVEVKEEAKEEAKVEEKEEKKEEEKKEETGTGGVVGDYINKAKGLFTST